MATQKMAQAPAPTTRNRPRTGAAAGGPAAQHKSRQVALGLRAMVRDLTPGDRLPSIAHLELQFGVSTGTVETAIRTLREEGLLVARRGSGVFVADGGGAATAGAEAAPAHTDTLAVIAPANVDFFRYFVQTLTEQASRRGRKVVCHYVPETEDDQRWVPDALHLEVLGPSGFLVLSHRLSNVAVALRERGHRTVLLGTLPMDGIPECVPCIYGDQEQGAFLAIEHLLNLGHRRIGCTSRIIHSRRFRGAQRAVDHVLGRSGDPGDVLRPVLLNWAVNPHARDENLRDWERDMQGEDAPTALFVWNDSHALEIIHVLDRFGLRAPRDLSIVAYDALPEGAYSRPPLTSVDGHVRTQVSHALDLLESPLPDRHVPRIAVTPTLVVRESTAPPRASPP